jgi:hypothetical protein
MKWGPRYERSEVVTWVLVGAFGAAVFALFVWAAFA